MSKQKLLSNLRSMDRAGTTQYAPANTLPELSVSWLDDASRSQMLAAVEASLTGSAVFITADDVTLVLPPFPIHKPLSIDNIELDPLIEVLERPRAYAAFLLRRGGYTAGFFRGDVRVVSKTDRRFVKNRHRAGGQSQGRYDRIRDKQVYQLLEKACADTRALLTPYEKEIEQVFLGGDRLLLSEFRRQCTYFARFDARIMPRRLPVTGDPRLASLDPVPREVTCSTVFRCRTERQ